MKILGITGRQRQRENDAAARRRALGGLGLDCDAIYHRLLETDAALVAAIGARFPARSGTAGSTARRWLPVVFADPGGACGPSMP